MGYDDHVDIAERVTGPIQVLNEIDTRIDDDAKGPLLGLVSATPPSYKRRK